MESDSLTPLNRCLQFVNGCTRITAQPWPAANLANRQRKIADFSFFGLRLECFLICGTDQPAETWPFNGRGLGREIKKAAMQWLKQQTQNN
jgi:hypothetical protein